MDWVSTGGSVSGAFVMRGSGVRFPEAAPLDVTRGSSTLQASNSGRRSALIISTLDRLQVVFVA